MAASASARLLGRRRGRRSTVCSGERVHRRRRALLVEVDRVGGVARRRERHLAHRARKRRELRGGAFDRRRGVGHRAVGRRGDVRHRTARSHHRVERVRAARLALQRAREERSSPTTADAVVAFASATAPSPPLRTSRSSPPVRAPCSVPTASSAPFACSVALSRAPTASAAEVAARLIASSAAPASARQASRARCCAANCTLHVGGAPAAPSALGAALSCQCCRRSPPPLPLARRRRRPRARPSAPGSPAGPHVPRAPPPPRRARARAAGGGARTTEPRVGGRRRASPSGRGSR